MSKIRRGTPNGVLDRKAWLKLSCLIILIKSARAKLIIYFETFKITSLQTEI
jgi:hypothetical protein